MSIGLPWGMVHNRLRVLLAVTLATSSGCDAVDLLSGTQEPQQPKVRPQLETKPRVNDQTRVGRPIIASPSGDLPLVGAEGDDPYGYPYARPDKIALAELARLRRFDELEAHLQAFVDAAAKDFHKEQWTVDAFDAFGVDDPELTAAIADWVKRAPDAWIPLLARSAHNHGRAWAIRGGGTVRETGGTKLDTFRAMSEEAMRDADAALALATHKLPVLERKAMTALGLGYTPEQHRALLDAQLAECASCYLPHRRYLTAMEPRWAGEVGGKLMLAHIDALKARVQENPRFEQLLHYAALDHCRTMRTREKYEEAVAACADASQSKEDLIVSVVHADVLRRVGKTEEALELFELVLSKWPQSEWGLRGAQRLHADAGHHRRAAELLLTMRRLEPADDKLHGPANFYMAELYKLTEDKLQRRDIHEAGKLADLAFALNPEHRGFLEMRGKVYAQKGIDPLREEMKQRPDDFNLMLTLDFALAQHREFPEIVARWSDYIERNPENGRAYYERGGAYKGQGKTGEANLDLVKSCDLGYAPACQRAKAMGLR